MSAAENMTEHKTVATKIFWDNEVQNRPATVPPHSINGGSAERGGETNPFVMNDDGLEGEGEDGAESEEGAEGEEGDDDGDEPAAPAPAAAAKATKAWPRVDRVASTRSTHR